MVLTTCFDSKLILLVLRVDLRFSGLIPIPVYTNGLSIDINMYEPAAEYHVTELVVCCAIIRGYYGLVVRSVTVWTIIVPAFTTVMISTRSASSIRFALPAILISVGCCPLTLSPTV